MRAAEADQADGAGCILQGHLCVVVTVLTGQTCMALAGCGRAGAPLTQSSTGGVNFAQQVVEADLHDQVTLVFSTWTPSVSLGALAVLLLLG